MFLEFFPPPPPSSLELRSINILNKNTLKRKLSKAKTTPFAGEMVECRRRLVLELLYFFFFVFVLFFLFFNIFLESVATVTMKVPSALDKTCVKMKKLMEGGAAVRRNRWKMKKRYEDSSQFEVSGKTFHPPQQNVVQRIERTSF